MDENKTKKSKSGLIVFIIIIALTVALTVFQIISSTISPKPKANFKKVPTPKTPLTWNFNMGKDFKKQKRLSPNEDYIAKIYIEGVIEEGNESYNQEWLLETIDSLMNDKNNVAAILFIDSPGGAVYQADEVYLKLLEYKKSKPLYAYMGSLAASGGYYIACASDYIMANRNTLTGSIGVIAGQNLDLTGLMEKVGVKSTTIHAGANKNMGSFNEPLSQEQKDILQSIADECYEQFTDIVVKSRPLTKEEVLNLADGRIYTAKQAQTNGLIDSIGSFDDAVSRMQNKEFDYKDLEVIDYKYEPEFNFYSMLRGVASDITKKANSSSLMPEAVEKAITPKTPYPAYFYDSGK